MSLKIRLRRMGSKKKPFYRLVAIDSRMARDGRFVEIVGYYDPMTSPPKVHVEEEVLFKWLSRGASPTVNVASLLKRVGALQKWELMKSGLSGAELDARVEAIKSQKLAASERRGAKKLADKAKKEEKAPAEEAQGAGSAAAETAQPEAPAES